MLGVLRIEAWSLAILEKRRYSFVRSFARIRLRVFKKEFKMWISPAKVLISLLVVSTPSLAMFCPKGFNEMNLGDSPDTVIATCGKPDEQTSNKKAANQPEAWVYYIVGSPGSPGTLKTEVAFDVTGKVINISVNGAGVSQTPICNNKMIQFGDSKETVKAACGAPAYVNPNAKPDDVAAPDAIETTTFIYKTDPVITLIFKDNKLVERK
jgi:hypothetical protein